MIASVLLSVTALTPWYIPAESTAARHLFGPAFLPHQIGQIGLYLALLVYATISIGRLTGHARARAKVFFVGGGVAALLALVLKLVAPYGKGFELAAGVPMLASVIFVSGAWLVSSQQLLDARHHLLAVLRRVLGLVAGAFVIAWLVETPWTGPRELQVIIATASGVGLALILDSLSGFLLERSVGRRSLEAAKALHRFTTEVAAMPAAELRGAAASDLAGILSSQEVAIYWRSGEQPSLWLVSYHPRPREISATLKNEHPLLVHSTRERAPWWISHHVQTLERGLEGLALCVPVIEREQVVLLVLVGHKRNVMGFSQAEVAAVQACALACHHTLTTRALLERENAQQQLVYAGKLAAGIAHNLRNPLAVVRAYLEADPGIPPAQLGELHTLAGTESERIQSTIDGLAALSRGERFALSPQDPAALIARAVDVNRAYLEECGADLVVVGPREPLLVLAEPWQLTTALTNLLRNSAEEIAREGQGTIRVEAVRSQPGCVEIRVSDSGRGLPAHIRDAVFSRDLFAQTTKATAAPGRRTGFGVGLHSTMLIVTIGHGGRFEYRAGAFVMTLPEAPLSGPRGNQYVQ